MLGPREFGSRLRQWWKNRGRPGRPRIGSRRRRLSFELLEDRRVLSFDAIGNTLASALSVNLTPYVWRSVSGAIDGPQDVDMFRVSLQAGDILVVDLDAQKLGSNLDGRLRLFDANGTELDSNNDTDGLDSALQYRAVSTGNYFVGVSDASNVIYDPEAVDIVLGDPRGDFVARILLDRTAADHNDLLNTADPVALAQGTSVSLPRDLNGGGDVDFYALNLVADEVLKVDVRSSVFGGFDPYLRVFDSSGNELAKNDDAVGSDPSQRVLILTAGTYYVGVATYANHEYDPQSTHGRLATALPKGFYELDLSVGMAALDNNDTLADAVPVDFDGTRSVDVAGTIDHHLDVDIYSVHFAAGQTTSIEIHAADDGSPLDSFLRIFDDTGAEVADPNDDGDTSVDSQLTFKAPEDADYFIAVSSSGNDAYDPQMALSGIGVPTSVGEYKLRLRPSLPDLVATTVHVTGQALEWGDRATVVYRVSNRGEADAAAFDIQIRGTVGDGNVSAFPIVQDRIAGLAAGATIERTLHIPLTRPRDAVGNLQHVRLNVTVDSHDNIPETDESNNNGPEQVFDAVTLPANLPRLVLSGNVNGNLPNPRAIQTYALLVSSPGRLQVTARPGSASKLDPVISLMTDDNRLLAQSDDAFFGHSDALFEQHLEPGVYRVTVTASGERTSGKFQLQTQFTAGGNPSAALRSGQAPNGIGGGDFNGDGRRDLAMINLAQDDAITVFLGQPGGTFENKVAAPLSISEVPTELAIGDFDGDTRLDLLVGCDKSAFVAFGRGDGSFLAPVPVVQDLANVLSVAAGDLNGDSVSDVLVSSTSSFSNNGIGKLQIFLGQRDRSFAEGSSYPAGRVPGNVQTADVNNDGKLDVLTADSKVVTGRAPQVILFKGLGNGQLQPLSPSPTLGIQVNSLTTADFDLDGNVDLVVANFGPKLEVLFGSGDGRFDRRRQLLQAGPVTHGVAVGDFNGDGHLDIATSDFAESGRIFLGLGNGAFSAPSIFGERGLMVGITAGDWNRDGRDDLALATDDPNSVEVLLARPDGTVKVVGGNFPVDGTPFSLAAADFDGDGRQDVLTGNLLSSNISVLLGSGNGSFNSRTDTAVGTRPREVVVADFNADGRPDAAVANNESGDVTVLLGLGNGTFGHGNTYTTGGSPRDIATADVNRDGLLDLLIVDESKDELCILLGRAEGQFAAHPIKLACGFAPQDLAVGDFNEDGLTDVAVAGDNRVGLFLGDRQSLLRRLPDSFEVGTDTFGIQAGDFNHDSHLDVAVVNFGSDSVSILFGNGRGILGPLPISAGVPRDYPVGKAPFALLTADFDGDGVLDFATANRDTSDVSVYLGRQSGHFVRGGNFHLDGGPRALAAVDFNGDGRIDLAVGLGETNEVALLLGIAGGQVFVPGNALIGGAQTRPLRADLNGDGRDDLAGLNQRGEVLIRLGRLESPNQFAPPVASNAASSDTVLPPLRARDLVLLATRASNGRRLTRLAALDSSGENISVYAVDSAGQIRTLQRLTLPKAALPSDLASEDINGDGLSDLVVLLAGRGEVGVFLATSDHGFLPLDAAHRLSVGEGAVKAALADVDGRNGPDLVVSNPGQGDVSVFANDGRGGFRFTGRYRAGDSLHGTTIDQEGRLRVLSAEESSSFTVGDFNEDGHPDIAVANPGTRSFSLLLGKATGGHTDPLVIFTGLEATDVVSGFLRDDNHDRHTVRGDHLDLAFLDRRTGQIFVFAGRGHGRFDRLGSFDAGDSPASLAIGDVNGDGLNDVTVVNEFGDVLHLIGRGDGTLKPYRRASEGIALAVADVNGDGHKDFVFGNEGLDRIAVDYGRPGQEFVQDRSDGLLAPGAVTVADVNVDGHPDLVIANSGGNSVVVYLGTATGAFQGGKSFFTGTQPTGISVADMNGDGLPDIAVANEGSNDVTVLLGSGSGSNWTATNGPRLRAGSGPVSTLIQDVTGRESKPDGIPDLVVTNSQSNNVFVLAGLGGGFFNDGVPSIIPTGNNPQQSIIGRFDGSAGLDLATINAGSNSVSFFPDFLSGGGSRSLSSGGIRPIAGLGGDFNFDGFTDLIVANNGNGVISLLLGGSDGLSLDSLSSFSGFDHPSALAAVLEGDHALVFGSAEGSESALLLFTFGTRESADESVGRSIGSLVLFADLFPLRKSSLALIATLLTTGVTVGRATLDRLDAELETEDDDSESSESLDGDALAVSQDAKKEGETDDAAANPLRAAPRLQRLILGLEEAIKELEAQEIEIDRDAPPKPKGDKDPTNVQDGALRSWLQEQLDLLLRKLMDSAAPAIKAAQARLPKWLRTSFEDQLRSSLNDVSNPLPGESRNSDAPESEDALQRRFSTIDEASSNQWICGSSAVVLVAIGLGKVVRGRDSASKTNARERGDSV